MDRYIYELRQKPPHHKNYFALGVSGCFTAIIFLAWSYANFGGAAAVVATKIPDQEVKETVSPFKNIGNGFASAITAFKDQFTNTGKTIENANLDDKYQQIRNDALDNQYGQQR